MKDTYSGLNTVWRQNLDIFTTSNPNSSLGFYDRRLQFVHVTQKSVLTNMFGADFLFSTFGRHFSSESKCSNRETNR